MSIYTHHLKIEGLKAVMCYRQEYQWSHLRPVNTSEHEVEHLLWKSSRQTSCFPPEAGGNDVVVVSRRVLPLPITSPVTGEI